MKKPSSSLLTSSTEEELVVAEILLDLPSLIKPAPSKSSFNFPQLTWSRKRRRSTLQQPAQDHRVLSPLQVANVNNNLEAKVEEKDNGGGVNTGTPNTPLDFVSTESDDKTNKHCTKKKSNKKSKKQYNEMIKELTETNQVLKREVENVRKYKDNLMDLNLKYKEMKDQVLKIGQPKEVYQSGMNLGRQSTEQAREIRTVSNQQPLIQNVLAQNYRFSLSPVPAQVNNVGLVRANRVGRFELPDLNVSAEDAFVVSSSQQSVVEIDERTGYREARRMRRALMRVKKLRNADGIKLPQHYYF